MNIKDYVEIAADPKYVKKISSIRYELNICDMTKPKDKNKF